MVNEEHLAVLKQGSKVWNEWRIRHSDVSVDLSYADLTDLQLKGVSLAGVRLSCAKLGSSDLTTANLHGAFLNHADLKQVCLTGANCMKARCSSADLSGSVLVGAMFSYSDLRSAKLLDANLENAHLVKADLSGADLTGANLANADLRLANLCGANLQNANLSGANLSITDLTHASFRSANLKDANLCGSLLVHSTFENATMTGAWVYGISAWDVRTDGAIQRDLRITPGSQPKVTVDNLDVAQFIYLILSNEKLRGVIDTITSKAVLILGRFTERRLAVLEAVAEELRNKGYAPIIFSFDQPANRSMTETVRILAQMSRFVIADITDPKSVPHELSALRDLTSVPVQMMIDRRQKPFSMAVDILNSSCGLPLHRYNTQKRLVIDLAEKVIGPAEERANEIAERRRRAEEEGT